MRLKTVSFKPLLLVTKVNSTDPDQMPRSGTALFANVPNVSVQDLQITLCQQHRCNSNQNSAAINNHYLGSLNTMVNNNYLKEILRLYATAQS